MQLTHYDYGNLNNEYTPMFDPLQMLKVTVNGQLFLLMLCEKLMEHGIEIDSCNTDGVTSIIPREKESVYKEICEWWQSITRMELEYDDFEYSIRKNVNNYLVKKANGKLKKKGLFKYGADIPLGDSVNAQVIPKCLEQYYVYNIEPDVVINNPEKYNLHIYDFCLSNKISKKYTVLWNGEKQQQLNRYYFSKNSPYLYKKKEGKKTLENVNVGLGVQLFNNYVEKPWDDYKINKSYYIAAVRKIITEMNNNLQLKLF